MYYELYREIFAELAGVEMPAAIEPPAVSADKGPVEADITPHLGSYERAGVLIEVLAGQRDKHGRGRGPDAADHGHRAASRRWSPTRWTSTR